MQKLMKTLFLIVLTLITLSACGGSSTPADPETNAAVVESEVEQTPEVVEPESTTTVSQQQAEISAQSYLDFTSFSRTGLIAQLEFEGFSITDATYGVDVLSVDWNIQAAQSAESYLDLTSFSRSGLIDQLSSEYGEQFTVEEATYGVDVLNADWNAQAARSAQEYLKFDSFSRAGLIDQLSSEYGEGFTLEQATYGVNAVGL